MKSRFVYALILLAILIAGCATVNYQADHVSQDVWKNFARIALEATKINHTDYRIVAKGAGASRDADIVEAWNEFADKIAAPHKYEKEYEWVDYTYTNTYPDMFTHHARMLSGTIHITDIIPSDSPNN